MNKGGTKSNFKRFLVMTDVFFSIKCISFDLNSFKSHLHQQGSDCHSYNSTITMYYVAVLIKVTGQLASEFILFIRQSQF